MTQKLNVKRRDEVKFIKGILTPLNPKDIFYVNTENLIKEYYKMILVGMVMILYFMLS